MIDVIIPTYRRYDLLPETLESVRGQTFKDWRCWITEDGCDPETEKCIRPFLNDERFTYITGEHSGCPAAARNRAIKEGKEKYIALLDNDDIWFPEKLEKQLTFMDAHPKCAMSGTNGYSWKGGSYNIDNLKLYHEKIPYGRISLNFLLKQNCFIASSGMVRRTSIEQAGLFNENLHPPIGEDIELWYRLCAVGELWFMEDPLILYRKHTDEKYYSTLQGENLKKWRLGLLKSVLRGTNIPSPYSAPENSDIRELVEDRINYFQTSPHMFGETGYKLKKVLGIIPRKNQDA
ncbi:MAG: glycosyltransferase [Proteobacteria bacterium]|nr:glycosyltransferase [Pseudomonadota bacterium]